MAMLDLLRSINDRLGGKPGKDIGPLPLDWMTDLDEISRWENEEYEKSRDEAEHNAKPAEIRSMWGY